MNWGETNKFLHANNQGVKRLLIDIEKRPFLSKQPSPKLAQGHSDLKRSCSIESIGLPRHEDLKRYQISPPPPSGTWYFGHRTKVTGLVLFWAGWHPSRPYRCFCLSPKMNGRWRRSGGRRVLRLQPPTTHSTLSHEPRPPGFARLGRTAVYCRNRSVSPTS